MVVLLLVACARCPTFEEMEVTDPDSVGDEGLVAEIEGAVADFQAWTGREGVCVPDREPILVEAGWSRAVRG